MRILSVHNKYRQRGGEDLSRDIEDELLLRHGHEVIQYGVTNTDLPSESVGDLISIGLNSIWAAGEYRKIRAVIRDTQPDIVDVHNFFPRLSPAVFHAAAEENVPSVLTLHNYRILCPGGLLLRDGKPCEDCVGSAFAWRGVLHGCYRNSRAATSAVALMSATHRILRTWAERVSAFFALSEVARERFVRGGLPPEKLFVKGHFLLSDWGVGSGDGNYALYVGRLSEEKGIRCLIEAWETCGRALELRIAGGGPLGDFVRTAAARNPAIRYLGEVSTAEVVRLLGEAMVLVFPSQCYENLPRVIVEAFCRGVPVIGSDISTASHLVQDGETGLLFKSGDAIDLVRKVMALIDDAAGRERMRAGARRTYEAEFTPNRAYASIMSVYDKLLSPRKQPHSRTGANASEHQ
jgi:glycosyltransferase involved in cell wall biosynthesis